MLLAFYALTHAKPRFPSTQHPRCLMKPIARLFLVVMLLMVSACAKPQSDSPTATAAEEPEVPAVTLLAAEQVFAESRFPTTAVDTTTGTTYVVFFRTESEVTDLYLASQPKGGTGWTAPVRVNSLDGEAHGHDQAPAQVAVGPNGAVYVVWANEYEVEGRRFGASDLFIARSDDGGATFSAQKAINSDAGGLPAGHTFHDMTIAPDGTIYVAWLDSRRSDARRAARAVQDEASPFRMVSHGMRHDPGTEVWVASSADGGETFSEGTVVARNTCECCRVSIAVAPNGTVYVAWRHIFRGGQRDIALATSTDGGASFTSAVRTHADGWSISGCPHSGPSIAVDARGRLHLGWYTGLASRRGIYYTHSADGKTFAAPEPLLRDVPISQIRLSGDGEAHVWLAWEDLTSETIHWAQTNPDGSLTRFPNTPLAGTDPALAGTASGVTLVSQNGNSIGTLQQ